MSNVITIDLDKQVDVPSGVANAEAFITNVLNVSGRRMGRFGSVSVVLVNDETIRDLNRTYRNVDSVTDVLSFSMVEGEDTFPTFEENELNPLGDIVVSIPTALRQAQEYGHSFQREFAFLLVHGFLHIIGYDHQDEATEQEMFGIQEQILESLGLLRD